MQVHVFISGFVQGVGFRYYVKGSAKQNNVTGWVKNLPDGRVEALFMGDKKSIEQMITVCKKGPFLSDVESVDVVWEQQKEEVHTDFVVIR